MAKYILCVVLLFGFSSLSFAASPQCEAYVLVVNPIQKHPIQLKYTEDASYGPTSRAWSGTLEFDGHTYGVWASNSDDRGLNRFAAGLTLDGKDFGGSTFASGPIHVRGYGHGYYFMIDCCVGSLHPGGSLSCE